WVVFGIMSVVTLVEVILGIIKTESLYFTDFLRMNMLNWIFIIIHVVNAYYIVWPFMHMESEKASLRWSVVGTLTFLILYLIFILLIEGDYIYGVFANSTIKWNF